MYTMPRRVRRSAASLVVLYTVAACSSGGSDPVAPPPPVTIAISPTSSTVNAGATLSFSATIANSSNSDATWTASGGTIAGSGLNATYTAPLGGGPFTITATSSADVTKSASATVTVTPIGITLSPALATIGAGGTQQFSATVVNSANTAVIWTAASGTISGTGNIITYIAPATGGTYTVTAASAADPAKFAVSSVTVTPVAITVTPTSQTLYRGEPVTLTSVITGTAVTDVIWTATCGAVNGMAASVIYTPPDTPGPCTVTVRSALDATVSSSATFTVRPVLRVAAFDDVSDGACSWTHCSLREAITAANAQPNVDTIRFFVPAASGRNAGTTITLTAALPVIATSTHLVGPGAALLTLNANGSVVNPRRALALSGALTGSVTGLSVRGGVVDAGGGIAITGTADVSLTDMTIVQNEARNGSGGGLQVHNTAIARLLRVVIDSNRVFGANQSGGGVSISAGSTVSMTGGRVSFNTVENGAGGGVRVFDASLTMDSVVVQGNLVVAGASGGGGMIIEGASPAQLTRTTVLDNCAPTGEGGGLRLLSSASVMLANSSVSGNSALLAGGMAAGNIGLLTVTGTTISDNTASTRAGGVFLWGTSDVTFTNSIISNNTAQSQGGGGGLNMQNTSIARLNGVTISGNRAQGISQHGGGIFAGAGTQIVMTNGSIVGNESEAGWGAGLYAFTNVVTLTDVTVRSNTASSSGVGAGLTVLDNATLTITGGSIRENRAIGGSGGGVFLRASTAHIQNVGFVENMADHQGGAMQVLGASTLNVSNSTFTVNRTALIPGVLNSGVGGALSIFDATVTTISNSVFTANTAAFVGGAIGKGSSGLLTVTDTRFVNNTAAFQGGALQLVGSGSNILRRITVSGNRATTSGASAASLGGGITNGSVMLLENSAVFENTSGELGGGIYSSTTANSTIRSTTLSGNTAPTGGGLDAAGPTALINVTLVANTASISGAGLSSSFARGVVTVSNSLLSGNLRAGIIENCATISGGTITSGGYNLSDDTSCTSLTGPTNRNNTPAGISASLADNGGPTRSHALQPGSAAINAANAATCPITDQRGFTRVGVCDIGAIEFGGAASAPVSGLRVAARFLTPTVASPVVVRGARTSTTPALSVPPSVDTADRRGGATRATMLVTRRGDVIEPQGAQGAQRIDRKKRF